MDETNTLEVTQTTNWMTPITHYLQLDEVPLDELKAKKICKCAAKYTMVSWKIYKMERASSTLRCLWEHKVSLVLTEVHQWSYDNHIALRAVAHKLLRGAIIGPI